MPSHNQGTVDIPPRGNGQLGGVAELSRSNTSSLASSFPGSPIHAGVMKRETVEEDFQKYVLTGTVIDGYCFSSHTRGYVDAPKIADVETGAAGLPGGTHVPNPSSPGAGSVDPKQMPAPPDGWQDNMTSRPPFIGAGTALEPADSSKEIARHKVKDYIMGKSSATSIGSYNKP